MKFTIKKEKNSRTYIFSDSETGRFAGIVIMADSASYDDSADDWLFYNTKDCKSGTTYFDVPVMLISGESVKEVIE